jgi:hypothetical protein
MFSPILRRIKLEVKKKNVVKFLTLLLCIWEVMGCKLSQHISYPDDIFIVFSVPQGK